MDEQHIERVEEIHDDEYNEIMAKIEAENKAKAEQQAAKILRKHRHEIKRLLKLAEGAVYDNNYESYKYAIMKLRDIYKQPYTDEIIKTGWETTRRQVWELINGYTEKV